MIEAQELISDNGISAIGLGFFTALLTLLGYVVKLILDYRQETKEAKDAANQASANSQAVVESTKNVSNGFAGSVLGKLERIDEKVDKLSIAHLEHLKWHIERKDE